jgi:hypothetical protein
VAKGIADWVNSCIALSAGKRSVVMVFGTVAWEREAGDSWFSSDKVTTNQGYIQTGRGR